MNTISQLPATDIDAELALTFCLRLTRAHATVTRRLDRVLSGLHGLSFADFLILHHLARAPGARLRRIELAEKLGLTASGVTRSLLPLEKTGLVSRQPDPRDARVGYATLSDSGRELLGHAEASVLEAARESTSVLPADRIDDLSALLHRLA
ncbi:MAG: MarR family transcriptional regulator [Burkholderiales bacterium]|nr:MarR family transcriptional regulator [Burkholderiales bacterium]